MDWKTKLGLAILPASAVLGFLADGLLRPLPLGLGAALWLTALVGVTVTVVRVQGIPLLGEGVWMLFAAAGFGFCLAWRDSTTLKSLDVGLILSCLAATAAWSRKGRVVLAGLAEHAYAMALFAYHTVIGPISLAAEDIAWREIPRGRWSRNAAAVGRGLIIAVPLLLLFGGLLAQADAVFERFLTKPFRVDAEGLASHIAITVVATWAVAGFFRGMLLRSEGEPTLEAAGRPIQLGTVEMVTVLGSLNLLFLAFVVVQIGYFFGGSTLVQARAGLTYAEYARRGFFELVAVSALCLPLLLAIHAFLRRESRASERIYRMLAGIQLALLSVIMASAIQRMRLYQDQYGLTELRFYTMAFMIWLGALFAWFAATVLTGRRERFAFGGLISAMAAVLVLHVLNPDAQIVNANIARAVRTGQFDANYNASLSMDSVPTLLQASDTLANGHQYDTKDILWARFANSWDDWRSWSWSRQEARRAARELTGAQK
jgi:hypothetical protein